MASAMDILESKLKELVTREDSEIVTNEELLEYIYILLVLTKLTVQCDSEMALYLCGCSADNWEEYFEEAKNAISDSLSKQVLNVAKRVLGGEAAGLDTATLTDLFFAKYGEEIETPFLTVRDTKKICSNLFGTIIVEEVKFWLTEGIVDAAMGLMEPLKCWIDTATEISGDCFWTFFETGFEVGRRYIDRLEHITSSSGFKELAEINEKEMQKRGPNLPNRNDFGSLDAFGDDEDSDSGSDPFGTNPLDLFGG